MRKPLHRQIGNFLPGLLSVCLFGAVVFWFILPETRQVIMDKKMETIQELTRTAWSVLNSYDHQISAGLMDRTEAEAHAIVRLRFMRYGPEGKNYFWINSTKPLMIMHPFHYELVGQDLTGYADPTGKPIFSQMARLATERGEGFVTYLWPADNDPNRFREKISYVKLFKPWNWIVGTGIYIDDVRAEIAAIRRRLLWMGTAVFAAVLLLSGFITWRAVRTDTERRRLARELTLMATTDSLTGACNRRCFWEKAELELERHLRYGRHMSLVLLDIDHFKHINDTYGHPAGDFVLKALVGVCLDSIRKTDLLGRVGGEEFAILLVETGQEDATCVAERLRCNLAAARVDWEGAGLSFTVSLGLTAARSGDALLDGLYKRADTAMYMAKEAGRNRLVTI